MSVEVLHISTIVLMVLGYFVLLYLICSCVMAICLYKMYVKWTKMDAETKERYENETLNEKNLKVDDHQEQL